MYKIVNGTIPREVCTNVPQTYCNKETKVVEDKTCQTETKIECTSSPSSSFEKSVSYKSGSSSGGYDDQDVKYSSSNGRSSVGHSSCHKKLETKCFTTPREVTMVNCFTQNERSCEYINEPAPRVVSFGDKIIPCIFSPFDFLIARFMKMNAASTKNVTARWNRGRKRSKSRSTCTISDVSLELIVPAKPLM